MDVQSFYVVKITVISSGSSMRQQVLEPVLMFHSTQKSLTSSIKAVQLRKFNERIRHKTQYRAKTNSNDVLSVRVN